MAFDLDDDELEATRKMHKGSDINVGSIEEDIERLNKLVTTKFNNDYSIDNVDKEAIEHLLVDYTRQKHINEEHQMINGELREKVKALEAENEAARKVIVEKCDYIQNKSVPKQKIKDIVFGSIHKGTVFKDEYIYPSDTCQYVVRRIVKELLQESEDK